MDMDSLLLSEVKAVMGGGKVSERGEDASTAAWCLAMRMACCRLSCHCCRSSGVIDSKLSSLCSCSPLAATDSFSLHGRLSGSSGSSAVPGVMTRLSVACGSPGRV